jgi:hypothetical protein
MMTIDRPLTLTLSPLRGARANGCIGASSPGCNQGLVSKLAPKGTTAATEFTRVTLSHAVGEGRGEGSRSINARGMP